MHRNWKTALALLLSAMLLLALAACSTGSDTTGGDATAAPTAEPTEAPTSEPVVLEPAEETEEPDDATTDTDATGDDADATGDDANATGDDADATGDVGLANPRVDYASVQELNEALGFTVYELDAASGYTAQSFTAIGGTIGEILYADDAGVELCLRTAQGTDDPSGVQGATLTDQSTEQVQIQSGSLDGTLVAYLTDGTMVCSITTTGLDQTAFDALVQQLAALLTPEM